MISATRVETEERAAVPAEGRTSEEKVEISRWALWKVDSRVVVALERRPEKKLAALEGEEMGEEELLLVGGGSEEGFGGEAASPSWINCSKVSG